MARRSGFPPDLPVSCLVPRESSTAAPTSGAQEKASAVRATAGSQPGIWGGGQRDQGPAGLGAEVVLGCAAGILATIQGWPSEISGPCTP